MGLILLAVDTAVDDIPEWIGAFIAFGTIVNPLGFVPLLFRADAKRSRALPLRDHHLVHRAERRAGRARRACFALTAERPEGWTRARLDRRASSVSEQGLGCMGMSEFYGTTDEARGDRDHPPGARARHHLHRHGRHVRPVHQREARRPGARRPARRRRARDEVRQRPRRGRLVRRHPRRRRVRALRLRRVAAAPRHRHDRPLLPAPRRPGGPDRGDRRRDGRAGRGGQGPLPRAVRGGAGHDPPRPRGRTRSPRCRASTRCGSAASRRRSSRPSASSASASSPTPRSAAASSPARSARTPTSTRTTPASSASPASSARTSSATSRWSRSSRRSPSASAARPGQLALAWVLSRGDDVVPIPGTKRRARVEENAGASDVDARRRRRSPSSSEAFPPGVAAGDRYAEQGMQSVER